VDLMVVISSSRAQSPLIALGDVSEDDQKEASSASEHGPVTHSSLKCPHFEVRQGRKMVEPVKGKEWGPGLNVITGTVSQHIKWKSHLAGDLQVR
jgi:hypothetical protein